MRPFDVYEASSGQKMPSCGFLGGLKALAPMFVGVLACLGVAIGALAYLRGASKESAENATPVEQGWGDFSLD